MILTLTVETHGPACHEITDRLVDWLRGKGDGVLTLLIRHTSASLLIQENADPEVQADLLGWLHRMAPPADDPSMGWITHRYEGPDDMPAHLKAAMLPTTLQVPVADGRMMLGRWQGIYVVEHRRTPHRRQVVAIFQPSQF
ncbi:secondary thiamine-phosphate synthase enzyme YjbQ [Paracoccus beibuensis]|uniref:secondary thiamine-phosphate synthase enzyme YjbQ n=1 Tax=Paracoccus beibuensis TaxID=547602 RepID=UPI00223F76EF|nr:secondary thiamine-phosphate synthase enzyme YjbQ [Paracoccus beibuensis]